MPKTIATMFAILVVALTIIAPFVSAQDAKQSARETKSVLVLTLRSSSNTTRCTNATMSAILFTDNRSVAGYYAENSYGQMTMSGDVSGPYTVDMTLPCTQPNMQKWADAADSAAAAAGVNVNAYDAKVYMLPPESTTKCSPWGGLVIGNRVWMRDDYSDSKHILAHELGHTFRARHTGTPGFTNSATYGDASSVMGGLVLLADSVTGRSADPATFDLWNSTAHFNAPQKIALGWLPGANVRTVTVGGSYKVALLENVRTDVQALKVIAGSRIYYCSYRRAVGFDSDLRRQYVDKTSVHISDNSGASTLNADLGDGQSYSNGQFTVSQTSHDATYAYLTVSFDTTTTPVAGRAQTPEPKIREIATIPDVAVNDEALRLPNGRVVLYTVRDSIMAYDLKAKRGTLVTRGFDGELAISPAGDRIAYVHASEDGKTDVIWVMPIDPKTGTATGPAQRVSTSAGDWPSFSPDGKLIAFRVDRMSDTWDLAVVPTAGGTERTLAKYDKRFRPVSWSADGTWIFLFVRAQGETSGSVERVPTAGGRSESLISYPPLVDNTVGQIDGHIALYRPDIAAQAEGRVGYITVSGAHGEFNIPPGSRGFVGSTQSLLTHTTRPSAISQGMPTSKIYELDVSPILGSIGKH